MPLSPKELWYTKEESEGLMEKFNYLNEDRWSYLENARRSSKHTSERKKLIRQGPMYNMPPVLIDFPFAGSTPSLEICNTFTVEQLHLFHSVISRVLKQ